MGGQTQSYKKSINGLHPKRIEADIASKEKIKEGIEDHEERSVGIALPSNKKK